ncbi:hypothetical protein DNK47_02515 [Mycoplasma wenyonii]|uniref:Uncharacterized protein n=1 Tax=Mycoplasma wenyonii TaxID=65123 RepID=A0A328PJC5_9MOLU|nr:hypothetical protein DNK47_02515 [Mycoplasma wenyonii]
MVFLVSKVPKDWISDVDETSKLVCELGDAIESLFSTPFWKKGIRQQPEKIPPIMERIFAPSSNLGDYSINSK